MHTLRKKKWICLALMCSVVSAYCGSRDIETVYGAESYNHGMTNYHYAVDETNFDIAAAGLINLEDNNRADLAKPFFYYIRNVDCNVKWHYLIDD